MLLWGTRFVRFDAHPEIAETPRPSSSRSPRPSAHTPPATHIRAHPPASGKPRPARRFPTRPSFHRGHPAARGSRCPRGTPPRALRRRATRRRDSRRRLSIRWICWYFAQYAGSRFSSPLPEMKPSTISAIERTKTMPPSVSLDSRSAQPANSGISSAAVRRLCFLTRVWMA